MQDRALLALAGLSAAYFLLLWLPSASPYYGFYSDELYYLACADRPALGYVDHPPFFVWVLRAHRALFGESLLALRALPAAAGAATLLVTGWMARRLGGGLYAQLLAVLAIACGQSLVLFSFFSVNCLGLLFWTVASWGLLELCRGSDRRLWVALGVLGGVSLLTKHTFAVWLVSAAVATLASPLRRDLRGPWLWWGLALLVVIASPNLYWQVANDWPSLDFYLRKAANDLRISPLDVLTQQIVVNNPATFPLWAGGLWFFMISEAGRRFRPLGLLFATALVIGMAAGQSVPYRIAGAFPVALAGGAVLVESARKPGAGRGRRIWNTWTLPAVMILLGGLAASFALPLFPPPIMTNHPLHDSDEWRREIAPNRLPYHLGNRTHWPQLVDEVRLVHADLDPEQRADAILLVDYFGHAGALEYYGRDLPPVYSPHTGYSLWGPPPATAETVIAVGIDEALLRRYFENTSVAATFRCSWCPTWQDDLPILVASSPQRPIAELWDELVALGGMDRFRRLLEAREAGYDPSEPEPLK